MEVAVVAKVLRCIL